MGFMNFNNARIAVKVFTVVGVLSLVAGIIAGVGIYALGSMNNLTTPPCSEGVNWYVMAEPVTIGARQLQQFDATIGANARPLQPVNKRLVLAPVE